MRGEGEGEDAYRHQCLVRWLIRMRQKDRNEAHRWLNGYTNEDGRWVKGWNQLHPGSRLEQDTRDQWAKGNRGELDDWR